MILALLIVHSASCILPYPHRVYSRHDVSGRLFDGNSGEAIGQANVLVEYAAVGVRTDSLETTTNSNGKFTIKGKFTRHWAILLSPVSMSLLPTHVGPILTAKAESITITKPGYQTIRQEFRSPDATMTNLAISLK